MNSAEFRSRVHNCAHPSIPKPFPVSEFREFRKSAIPGFPFPAPRFPHPNSPIPVPGIPPPFPDSGSPIPESPPHSHATTHPPATHQNASRNNQPPKAPGAGRQQKISTRKLNKHKSILRVSKQNIRTNYRKKNNKFLTFLFYLMITNFIIVLF